MYELFIDKLFDKSYVVYIIIIEHCQYFEPFEIRRFTEPRFRAWLPNACENIVDKYIAI